LPSAQRVCRSRANEWRPYIHKFNVARQAALFDAGSSSAQSRKNCTRARRERSLFCATRKAKRTRLRAVVPRRCARRSQAAARTRAHAQQRPHAARLAPRPPRAARRVLLTPGARPRLVRALAGVIMARGRLAVALALLVCSSAIAHAAALHPAGALATGVAAPRRSLLGFRSPEEESQHKKEREALVTVRARAHARALRVLQQARDARIFQGLAMPARTRRAPLLDAAPAAARARPRRRSSSSWRRLSRWRSRPSTPPRRTATLRRRSCNRRCGARASLRERTGATPCGGGAPRPGGARLPHVLAAWRAARGARRACRPLCSRARHPARAACLPHALFCEGQPPKPARAFYAPR
jgi:hypothetical protein